MAWVWRIVGSFFPKVTLKVEPLIVAAISTWLLHNNVIHEDAWSHIMMAIVGVSGADRFAQGLVSGVKGAIPTASKPSE